MHAHRVGAGPVDLVHDDDRGAAQCQRLPQHEPRLRHRAVEGVHHEQHAVNHAQNPLNFAAEIGVAGRINNIDFRPVPTHARVLREDGDPALAFERIRVHHALGDDLILAKGSGLSQHLVHERCLAVIDVGDDGDVAYLHSLTSITGRRPIFLSGRSPAAQARQPISTCLAPLASFCRS